MPLFPFPPEIITVISHHLSNNDRIVCMKTCSTWYTHFRRTLFHSINLHNRQQVKKLLNVLRNDPAIGICVREFRLDQRVGITQQELDEVAAICPYIEAIDFFNWGHLSYDTFSQFHHLKRIPKLINLGRSAQALIHAHKTLTHIEFGEYFLRQIVRSNVLMSCICTTKNLTHLTLCGYISALATEDEQLSFSQEEWYKLHSELPLLEYIKMSQLSLTNQHFDTSDVPTAQKWNRMKHLVLDITLTKPAWLPFFAQLYPRLHSLDLTFGLTEFVSYDASRIILDATECQLAFIKMFENLKSLKSIKLSQMAVPHFPAEACFRNAPCKLDKIGIRYCLGAYPRKGFDQVALEALVASQKETVKGLLIDIWSGAYDDLRQVLGPLAQCERLTSLTLASDNLVTFHYYSVPIDLILDYCPKLKKLKLLRTALEVDDKHSAKRIHPLEHLSLAVSRVSEPLFLYLSKRCPKLNDLEIATCSWGVHELHMKVTMPHHAFKRISITDLNKLHIVGLEGDLGRRGTSVNLFSVRQNASIEKTQMRYWQAKADDIPRAEDLTRWYHLYEIDDGRLRYPPCNIRRLFENEVHSLHHYVEARAQHYSPDLMLTSGYAMETYVPRSAWRDDIDCGFISIECKSVETFKYNFNYIT